MKILFLLLLITACGQIPIDSTPAPIDNNLWTLEMRTQSSHDVGLLGTSFSRDKGPGDQFLEIPVVGKGLVSIRSERCLYERSEQYSVGGWTTKKFQLSDLVEKVPDTEFACIFNVLLFVEGFDKGFQGQFFVQIKDAHEVPLAFSLSEHDYENVGWHQFRDGASLQDEILFKTKSAGSGVIEGCGLKRHFEFTKDFSTSLSELTGVPKYPGCVFTLGFKYLDGSYSVVELNIKMFNKDIVSLPDPILSYDNEKLRVEADEVVTYIGINETYTKKKSLRKRVKKDQVVFVRLITANGRFTLLKVINGEIVWKSSSRF